MPKAALLFCLAAFVPASQAAAQTGGFVLVREAVSDGNDAASTGNGVIDTSDAASEAAILLEGREGGLEWRVRGQVTGSTSDFPEDAKIRLTALSYGQNLTERVYASIGKQQQLWGAGLSYQPLGFFRTQTNLRDPTDAEGRAEGLPMIYLSRLGDPLTLEAIYADELRGRVDGQKTRQWAVRTSGQAGRLDASAIMRQRFGNKVGFGGSGTFAVTVFNIYGDFYYGPPERRRRVDDRIVQPIADFSDALPLQNGMSRRASYVVGVTYTPTSRLAFTSELVRRGEGLNSRQWNAFVAGLEDSASSLDGRDAPAAFAFLGNGLQLLSDGPARRDYFFQRASWTGRTTTAGLNATFGLDDGGVALTGSFGWSISPRFGLTASVTGFFGSNQSEYGLSPVKTVASLSLRRSFDF